MIIQMKATEQYFPVLLFVMPYKVVLTFESVDGIQNAYNMCAFTYFTIFRVFLHFFSTFVLCRVKG